MEIKTHTHIYICIGITLCLVGGYEIHILLTEILCCDRSNV